MIRVPLKNISLVINSGLTPLRSNQKFWLNGNIPWVKTEQLGEKNIYDSNEKITSYALENTSIKLNPSNTLSVAMYGEGKTRGSVSILRNETTTNQACCNIVIDEKKANFEFVYYYLKTQYNNLRNLSSGVRKNLNSNDIKNFEINLPNLSTQKQIAKVLSDLDAKIEVNNKINQELEAMAKTIYDYWFVQFDFPDANGKPYKSSGGQLVYNEVLKRAIPEGWENCILGDVVSKTGTGLNPRDNFKLGEGDNFYVTIKNIKQGKVVLDDKCDKISDESLEIINNRSDLRIGDILYTSIEPVGTTYFIREKPSNWNINESVFTIRANNEKLTSEFLYMFLSGDYIKAYTNNVSAGSIHKGVRHGTLKDCKFILPKKNIINEFSEKVIPLFDKLDLIQKENQKLSELRDWLLPMLMNGQVSITNKELPITNTKEQLGMVAEENTKYGKE